MVLLGGHVIIGANPCANPPHPHVGSVIRGTLTAVPDTVPTWLRIGQQDFSTARGLGYDHGSLLIDGSYGGNPPGGGGGATWF